MTIAFFGELMLRLSPPGREHYRVAYAELPELVAAP